VWERTGVSASVFLSLTLSLASRPGRIGTLMSILLGFTSASNSGMYMKSIVELSLTAFRLLLVAGRRGALERPTVGLSDVSSEEKVVEPVIESERVLILEVEVRALTTRAETRAVDIAVVLSCEVCGWKWYMYERK
jgi:hypothetical protein